MPKMIGVVGVKVGRSCRKTRDSDRLAYSPGSNLTYLGMYVAR